MSRQACCTVVALVLSLACGGRAADGDNVAPEPLPPASAAPEPISTAVPAPAATSEPDGRFSFAEAEALLDKYCGECHGRGAIANDNVQGGIDYIDDIEALVQNGLIIPLNPDASLIVQRIEDGSMPPGGQQARPTAADIARLRKLIDPMLFWSEEAPPIAAPGPDPLLRSP